jgi:CheY-like chemotaxis protein
MIKVLLVEDNLMISDMIAERLEFMGYQISCALSGEEALEQMAAEQPDVILMDISLPGMDGWETTRKLKADPRTRHIPVIALTAHAMVEVRERSLAAGCADFEVKPINFSRLTAKIDSLAAGPSDSI